MFSSIFTPNPRRAPRFNPTFPQESAVQITPTGRRFSKSEAASVPWRGSVEWIRWALGGRVGLVAHTPLED